MILTFVDHERGVPDELSLEALTFGRRLAERLGVAHEVVIVDDDGSRADELSAFGVAKAHLARIEGDYAPIAWGRAITELVRSATPVAAVAAASDRGSEVMAHAATLLDAPLAANCQDVDPSSDDAWTVTRQRWGGSLLEEGRLTSPVKLLTVAPHAVRAERGEPGGAVEVSAFAPALGERDLDVRVAERVAAETGGVSLAQAKVVVGGGRGVGSAEGFGPLEELAGLLGGAVGCSRVVTSNGWRPHTDQVGQTGTRIAPDLYVACGISGATQHIVGCRAAKKILVINTDPEAPILSQADYAIIGDLASIVPAINAEIRKTNA